MFFIFFYHFWDFEEKLMIFDYKLLSIRFIKLLLKEKCKSMILTILVIKYVL